MTIWTANFYETIHGVRPVEVWLDSLTEQKFAAMDAAILLVLQPKGLTPGDTKWLTACGSSSTSMERKSSYFFTAMTKQEMTTNETNNIKSIWHENV